MVSYQINQELFLNLDYHKLVSQSVYFLLWYKHVHTAHLLAWLVSSFTLKSVQNMIDTTKCSITNTCGNVCVNHHQASPELATQSGGYDVELFVDPPDYELICSICQGVLRCPVRTACHHIFCKKCILQWLKRY